MHDTFFIYEPWLASIVEQSEHNSSLAIEPFFTSNLVLSYARQFDLINQRSILNSREVVLACPYVDRSSLGLIGNLHAALNSQTP
tara:strand:- start:425 stop:679 length:255 start_codon:yes stop_codon:yes gene_type:complete